MKERKTFARSPTNGKVHFLNHFPVAEEAKRIKDQFHWMFHNPIFLEHRSRWLDIRENQLSYLGEFIDTEDITNPGRKRDKKAKDGAAWRANLTFAGGMASGLTPQSVEWFKLNFENPQLAENYQGQVVLDQRLKLIYRVLAGSNFYNSTHANYLELAFGQAPLGIFEHPVKGLYFEPYSIGSYAYDVDAWGIPCRFAVQKKMTAHHVREMFARVPEIVERAIKENKGFSKEFTVCWLVEKNPDADRNKLGKGSLPIRSIYWLKEQRAEEFIHVGGFEEFPIAIARYQVIGKHPYAIGPGHYADGDTRMLYKLLAEAYANTEMFSRPPLQAIGTMPVDYRPGGITRTAQAGGKVETLFNTVPIMDKLFQIAAAKKEDIDRAYHVNLFTMLDQSAMDKSGRTAYELALRNQEKMQQLGPVVERQNSEYLNVVVERSYGILERNGSLPPFSEEILSEMNGEDIKIEYVSPLAQAQKMTSLEKNQQLLAFAGQLAQLKPEAKEMINVAEFMYDYARGLGTDAKLLLSKEEFQEKMAAAMAQVEEERTQNQLLAGAPAAKDITAAAANLQDMADSGANPAMDMLSSATGGLI